MFYCSFLVGKDKAQEKSFKDMEARVKGNLETFIETQAVQRGLKERLPYIDHIDSISFHFIPFHFILSVFLLCCTFP